MAQAPHLVETPGSRLVELRASTEWECGRLASVRWQVHVANPVHGIADTARAGADVELLRDGPSQSCERDRPLAGRLLLTFWVERGTPQKPNREVLAAFTDHSSRDQRLPGGVAAQAASFVFTTTRGGLSLDVCSEKPLLCITEVSGPGERQKMTWGRGIIHELLGLKGGQYRVDEVRIERAMVSLLPTLTDLAREAG